MDKTLQTKHSIIIKAGVEKVWDILTNPDYIAQYLFGTRTTTDWKMGSEISFDGNYDGHAYSDKGIVMVNQPYQLLAYDYWSQFSGLEDSPENYCEVSYQLQDNLDGTVQLIWQQIGFKDASSKAHNEASMPAVMSKIKELAEE